MLLAELRGVAFGAADGPVKGWGSNARESRNFGGGVCLPLLGD